MPSFKSEDCGYNILSSGLQDPELLFSGAFYFCLHGIVAAASPGMAAQDATNGAPCPFEGAVFADGFDGILRACRREATCWRRQGRDVELVETNGLN